MSLCGSFLSGWWPASGFFPTSSWNVTTFCSGRINFMWIDLSFYVLAIYRLWQAPDPSLDSRGYIQPVALRDAMNFTLHALFPVLKMWGVLQYLGMEFIVQHIMYTYGLLIFLYDWQVLVISWSSTNRHCARTVFESRNFTISAINKNSLVPWAGKTSSIAPSHSFSSSETW